MREWNTLVAAGLILLMAACGTPTPLPLTPVAPTSEIVVTPIALPESTVSPRIVTPLPTPDATRPLTLTLWVPEEFGPGAERGGDILQERVTAFEQAHPGIHVDHVLKAPYGKGGVIDWIVQLQELMPDRLPDAAIVDSRELYTLSKLGLLQPLNRAMPSGAYWDLFLPAQRIARQSGVWDNQPLVLDTEHLVYDTRRLAAPPLSWQDILTTTTPFAFAADSTDTFLLHYLHDGGTFSGSASDTGVMQNILDYYQRARGNGNLSEASASMKSAREIMPLFVSGQVPMAQVRARDFLAERPRVPNAAVASVPTLDGQPAAVASGWSFVILTPNPVRRRVAEEYLQWLDDADFMGEWAQAARMLPASKSAFDASGLSEADAQALRQVLERAMTAPSFQIQSPYGDVWHAAVQAVLSGQLSPEDAAFRALQSITQ